MLEVVEAKQKHSAGIHGAPIFLLFLSLSAPVGALPTAEAEENLANPAVIPPRMSALSEGESQRV